MMELLTSFSIKLLCSLSDISEYLQYILAISVSGTYLVRNTSISLSTYLQTYPLYSDVVVVMMRTWCCLAMLVSACSHRNYVSLHDLKHFLISPAAKHNLHQTGWAQNIYFKYPFVLLLCSITSMSPFILSNVYKWPENLWAPWPSQCPVKWLHWASVDQ